MGTQWHGSGRGGGGGWGGSGQGVEQGQGWGAAATHPESFHTAAGDRGGGGRVLLDG